MLAPYRGNLRISDVRFRMPKPTRKKAPQAKQVLKVVLSEEQQEKVDAFLERVLVFVDRNGRVKGKTSSPMHSALSMEYELGDLKIKMHASAFAQGNGSCGATVHYKGKKVYAAAGCYTAAPWDVEETVHEKGPWERLIKKYPKRGDE